MTPSRHLSLLVEIDIRDAPARSAGTFRRCINAMWPGLREGKQARVPEALAYCRFLLD